MSNEVLVYIERVANNHYYYARWSRTLRQRTHAFTSEVPLPDDYLNKIRNDPESIGS